MCRVADAETIKGDVMDDHCEDASADATHRVVHEAHNVVRAAIGDDGLCEFDACGRKLDPRAPMSTGGEEARREDLARWRDEDVDADHNAVYYQLCGREHRC